MVTMEANNAGHFCASKHMKSGAALSLNLTTERLVK
jgi:hypothetical protein